MANDATQPTRGPVISVVIRCRNEAHHLRMTLTALRLQQTDFSWEVIVVDNESTDSTLEVCREFGATVVQIPRRSFTYGRALNEGIAASRGEFIVLLSAHSLPVGSGFLKAALDPFTDPRIMAARFICVTNYRDVNSWYEPRDISYATEQEQREGETGLEWVKIYPSAGGSILRRTAWDEVKFNESLEAVEDKVWASEILRRGYKVRYCSESTYAYLKDRNTRDKWRKRAREHLALYRINGYVPLRWHEFLIQAAATLVRGPIITLKYVAAKLWGSALLVLIPLRAKFSPRVGSTADFDRHAGPVDGHG